MKLWTKCGLKTKYKFLKTFVYKGFQKFKAESEGFEPPEPRSSTVFKTAAIDHSANSPRQK
jgi:hypothetical protein